MTKWIVDWKADGQFVVEADYQIDALDKAYDFVRDYLDLNQLGGDFSIFVEEY